MNGTGSRPLEIRSQMAALGFWSTAHLPPSRYEFMLIVIDKTGNSQECIVPVIIQR